MWPLSSPARARTLAAASSCVRLTLASLAALGTRIRSGRGDRTHVRTQQHGAMTATGRSSGRGISRAIQCARSELIAAACLLSMWITSSRWLQVVRDWISATCRLHAGDATEQRPCASRTARHRASEDLS